MKLGTKQDPEQRLSPGVISVPIFFGSFDLLVPSPICAHLWLNSSVVFLDFTARFGPGDLFAPAPGEPDFAGVERVVRKNELLLLIGGQTVLHQGEIEIFVAPIKFVANDRMANVGQVNAKLMLAASVRAKAQEREGFRVTT